MLTIQALREEKDRVLQALSKRHIDVSADIERVLEWDAQRRNTQSMLDDLLAQSNTLSREIGGLIRDGKKEEAEAIKSQTADLKEQSAALKTQMHELEASIQALLCMRVLSHIGNWPNGTNSLISNSVQRSPVLVFRFTEARAQNCNGH